MYFLLFLFSALCFTVLAIPSICITLDFFTSDDKYLISFSLTDFEAYYFLYVIKFIDEHFI